MDPSTSQLMLYSISDAKCFGFDVMLIEVGFTVNKNGREKFMSEKTGEMEKKTRQLNYKMYTQEKK